MVDNLLPVHVQLPHVFELTSWSKVVVAHVILVSAQVPIGPFDFGTAFGLGLRLGWTGIGTRA